MAVAEQDQTEQSEQTDASSGTRTALKAAAAAAATGAATYAVRKALSHDGDNRQRANGDGGDEGSRSTKGKSSPGSILSTAASSAWESASEVLLPMADDAAAAAGKYLAESAPDVVRERLVPRFIEAFNNAG
jgi:hypothetical protein